MRSANGEVGKITFSLNDFWMARRCIVGHEDMNRHDMSLLSPGE